MPRKKKIYRDEMEKIFDFLELCSKDRVSRTMLGRVIKLSTEQVTEFITILMELSYLESIDSGVDYGKGRKMMYYKTTPKGNDFKRQISDWVELKRKYYKS